MLSLVTAPMIKRFVLPEAPPGPPQDLVRVARRVGLDTSHNSRYGQQGPNQNVHMIRHHHVRIQFVVLQFITAQKRIANDIRYARIREPLRTSLRLVKHRVQLRESPRRSRLLTPPYAFDFSSRHGTTQPPRDEHRTILRKPMRPMASIKHKPQLSQPVLNAQSVLVRFLGVARLRVSASVGRGRSAVLLRTVSAIRGEPVVDERRGILDV